ncbi:MAG: lactate racemase domain-containing protein [Deltaproteobacteria bacterium]|nr:lactate racemase domain-containing protein [Deltaproteobacteria bacterium]
MSGPDKKIVIGFTDRVEGGARNKAHRRIAITIIVEELLKGGAKIENITLLCAVGLHRQNTLEEWYWYLGKEIVNLSILAEWLIMTPKTQACVTTVWMKWVMLSSATGFWPNADLPILSVSAPEIHMAGIAGGYKMLVTGHSGWRSIGSHHCPETMHRRNWLGASTKCHMHRQFNSIGLAMEEGVGKEYSVRRPFSEESPRF